MKVIISDTSVLLNLLAADCLDSLTSSTGWQLAVCPIVVGETKKLRDVSTGEMVVVDLTPFIISGVLQVLDMTDADEKALFVEQAGVVDDGEAMSIAIAASRNLELAIDDRQATNHSLRKFPTLRVWSTPEILKTWFESASLADGVLCAAIRRIEERARYFPAKSHPLCEWWHESKALSR